MSKEQTDCIEAKRKLQADAGIPHLPTDLTYECRLAVAGEGPRAYDWSDKPHRLVYDLCRAVEALSAVPAEAQAVAWLLTHPVHGETLSQHPITDGDRSLGWTDIPLYATSPSPAGGVQGVRIAELEAALRPLVYIAEWHEGTLAHDSDTIIEFKNADGSSYSLTVGHARDARTALTAALSSQAQTTGGVE